MISLRKTKTWQDNLNDVIRDVFFVDEELLDLMLIPSEEREDIIGFIKQYLIRSIAPDEILTDERVRVCYSEEAGRLIGSNILKKYLYFDIYVKTEDLHNCGDDLLAFRTMLIAQRLQELLTDQKYVCRIDFNYEDEYDLYTKLVGYTRYRIVFSYKISF